jgi:Domain of unknown function (DUF1841)
MSVFTEQSREQLRGAYRQAWRKWRERLPLQPLEAQIADVIRLHPEYHAVLEDEASIQHEFGGGGPNPYLHLGLHLALREQLGTDRPAGIVLIHRGLVSRGSAHEAEHRMIEVLAAVLSDAQRGGRPADEAVYLERLRRL